MFSIPPTPARQCASRECAEPPPHLELPRGPLPGQSQNHSTAPIFFRSQFPHMCGGEIFYSWGCNVDNTKKWMREPFGGLENLLKEVRTPWLSHHQPRSCLPVSPHSSQD